MIEINIENEFSLPDVKSVISRSFVIALSSIHDGDILYREDQSGIESDHIGVNVHISPNDPYITFATIYPFSQEFEDTINRIKFGEDLAVEFDCKVALFWWRTEDIDWDAIIFLPDGTKQVGWMKDEGGIFDVEDVKPLDNAVLRTLKRTSA